MSHPDGHLRTLRADRKRHFIALMVAARLVARTVGDMANRSATRKAQVDWGDEGDLLGRTPTVEING